MESIVNFNNVYSTFNAQNNYPCAALSQCVSLPPSPLVRILPF